MLHSRIDKIIRSDVRGLEADSNYKFPVKDDVGHVPRQLLTGADGLFGVHDDLTLFNNLARGQVPQRAMWPVLIVIGMPGFDDELCCCERGELMHVQTFIPQAAVERLNEGILHRFSGSDEVELNASTVDPFSSARD